MCTAVFSTVSDQLIIGQTNGTPLEKIKAMFRFLRNVFQSLSVAINCKLRNCKVHKGNNKWKSNVPLFNDL